MRQRVAGALITGPAASQEVATHHIGQPNVKRKILLYHVKDAHAVVSTQTCEHTATYHKPSVPIVGQHPTHAEVHRAY